MRCCADRLSVRRGLRAGLLALGLVGLWPSGDALANGIDHFFAGEELSDAEDRFMFDTTFSNPTQPILPVGPPPSAPDDGFFFFHNTENAEVLTRMLDRGAPSEFANFVFFGSQTSIGISKTVTNTNTMRVEVKTGIIGPGGFRTTTQTSFNQGVTIRNTTDDPIGFGFKYTGSHDASGTFPVGPGSSTSHTFTVDVNNGEPGFIDFSTQGHFNTFSPGFNGAVGGLFPVGITQPAPGTWEFNEDASPISFGPTDKLLEPGEEATYFLTGSVSHVLTNTGDSLASYDGFNTTIFDFELSDPGLQIVALVPEPTSLAILGLVGLSTLRRRRG